MPHALQLPRYGVVGNLPHMSLRRETPDALMCRTISRVSWVLSPSGSLPDAAEIASDIDAYRSVLSVCLTRSPSIVRGRRSVRSSRVVSIVRASLRGYGSSQKTSPPPAKMLRVEGDHLRECRRCCAYSYRKATTGATLVARRAGTKVATSATAASKNTTPIKVTGSPALTP